MNDEYPTFLTTSANTHCYIPDAGTAGAYFQQVPTFSTFGGISSTLFNETPIKEKKEKHMDTKRLVKVFIVDSDDNLPIDKSILFQGPEMLTDSTDQELFFNVPIRELLEKHNELRKGVENKKATAKKGESVYLEPVRIRDLKMIVQTIVSF